MIHSFVRGLTANEILLCGELREREVIHELGEAVTIISAIVAIVSAVVTFVRTARTTLRDQASKIAVWGKGDSIVVSNMSHQPIYQVIVSSVVREEAEAPGDLSEAMLLYRKGENGLSVKGKTIDSSKYRRKVACVPPGRALVEKPEGDERKGNNCLYEVSFYDAGNRMWVRYADGRIKRHRFASICPLYSEPSIPKSWSKIVCDSDRG